MQTLAEGELMARRRGPDRGVSGAHRAVGAQRGALVGTGNNGADALYAVAGLALTGVNCAALHLSGKVHPGAYAAALAAGVVLLAADETSRLATFSWGGGARAGRQNITNSAVSAGSGHRPRWDPRHRWSRWTAALGATWVAAVPDTAYVIAVDVPSGQDPTAAR